MFGWNQNGKKDTGDSFIDFMIFNEVINGDRKKQTGKGQRRWPPCKSDPWRNGEFSLRFGIFSTRYLPQRIPHYII